MTARAADLRRADQEIQAKLARAEQRVRELEVALVLHLARRDTRRGQGWVRNSRQSYRCYRCRETIPIRTAYYRTTHKRKNGETLRVCYCRSCAIVLGHGQPIGKKVHSFRRI